MLAREGLVMNHEKLLRLHREEVRIDRQRADRELDHLVALGIEPGRFAVDDGEFNDVLGHRHQAAPDLVVARQAAQHISARERPLALYCFSNDENTISHVLAGVTSGGVTVNGTLLHYTQESLPFGGIGASGMGAYHGEEGFRRLSHARAVFKVGAFNSLEHLGPPWGSWAGLTARFLGR